MTAPRLRRPGPRAALLVATLAPLVPLRAAHAACEDTPALCGLQVHSTIEQSDFATAIDVVLVGDGFTSAASWASAAASAIATIKAYTAAGMYGSVPALYNFHVVDVLSATSDVADDDRTDTALGMRIPGPFITADAMRVSTAALNAPDVDVVIAIGNSGGGRANANYPGQLASGGSVRLGLDNSPIAHELGHALIHLADEYEESGLCGANSEPGLFAEPNVTTDPTCAKFSHVPGAGCVQGGHYCSSGVYRSAGGCLMRTSGNAGACPVCAAEIRHVLVERRTGVDRASAWAVPTGLPAPPTPVNGRVQLLAIAGDHGFGPLVVSFTVDGRHVGQATATPGYTGQARLELDTARVPDGAHTLQVFVDDAAGHSRRGASVAFVTANHTAPTTATVTLASPTHGATLRGYGWVSATVPVDVPAPRLLYVELDGAPAFGTTARNLGEGWPLTSVATGLHELRAVAVFDGVVKVSQTIQVDVQPETGGGVAGGNDPGGGEGGTEQPGGERAVNLSIHDPPSWSAVGPLFRVGYGMWGFQAGAVELALRLDEHGTPLPLGSVTVGAGGHTGSVMVDSSAWALAPHVIELVATQGATHGTSRPSVVVRATPTAPVAYISRLPAADALRGVVTVELAGHAPSGMQRIELRANGVLVGQVSGAAGSLSWDTRTWANQCYALAVRAVASSGAVTTRAESSVCIDNAAPVVGITAPAPAATVGSGVTWIGVNATDAAGSIETLQLRVDGVAVASGPPRVGFVQRLSSGAHALQLWARDRAGNEALSAVVNVTVADCAATGCNDGNPCTVDTCAPDGCQHEAAVGCCVSAADCADTDPCTTEVCNTGTCVITPTASCCAHGFTCSDGDPCTRDVCSPTTRTCSNPAGECCAANVDCDDGWSCTTDACIAGPGGACATDRAGNCCAQASDCDDGDPCTTDSCGGGTCSHAAIAGCCASAEDCADGDVCTFDSCDLTTHTCQGFPRAGCCDSDADCASLDPCVTASCDVAQHVCRSNRAAECCTFGFECADADPCTSDTCSGSTCTHGTGGVCCAVDADCEDGDACTAGACDGAGRCTQAALPGCCNDDAACDDGDPCTADTCTEHACANAPIGACCTRDDECGDGNTCTSDRCDANACIYTPVTDCCADASECNDGDACTDDRCEAGACVRAAIDGCCADPEGCDSPPDDGGPGPDGGDPTGGDEHRGDADEGLPATGEDSAFGRDPTRVAGGCASTGDGGVAAALGLLLLALRAARRQRAKTCRSISRR